VNNNDRPDDPATPAVAVMTKIHNRDYRVQQADLVLNVAWAGGNLPGGSALRLRKIPLVLTIRDSNIRSIFAILPKRT
jgi:hypothetical protein